MIKQLLKYCIISLILIIGCTNPFAPKLSDKPEEGSILGDQTTVDGVFQNLRYAYQFKDTLIYGNLLNDDFRFKFTNYETSMDESWGRDEDMLTTSRLFQASKSIDLTWNDVTNEIGDSVLKDISRGFNLNVVFSSNDIINVYGRVNLRITRKTTQDEWKISIWRDESNF